jgi:D-glycero-alpha-D-manno-heptose-7-phosphate kinase
MIIRSRSPLRISFAGGGTEVEPYLSEQGGAVLSTTIDKYAYCSLRVTAERGITVNSLDYDIVAKYRHDEPLDYDGKLDLVKAVIRHLNPERQERGLEFFLHTDAPPGSGLGSSSTLVVALIAALKHLLHLPLTSYEIADLAYHVERVDLGIKGGKQDQYATTFGGVNYIEFYRDATIVNPLRISPDTLSELHHNLLLCYTGRTRMSGHIIDQQVDGYVRRTEHVVRSLDQQKRMATELKNALLRGKLNEFGHLLHEAWQHKKQMADGISDPKIDELYDTARNYGAHGGKITGAGGGGYMFFYCRFDKKHIVAKELEKLGARVVSFGYDFQGVQTWEAR